jgi:hypothetical protein
MKKVIVGIGNSDKIRILEKSKNKVIITNNFNQTIKVSLASTS